MNFEWFTQSTLHWILLHYQQLKSGISSDNFQQYAGQFYMWYFCDNKFVCKRFSEFCFVLYMPFLNIKTFEEFHILIMIVEISDCFTVAMCVYVLIDQI